jgi:hypothetical protein
MRKARAANPDFPYSYLLLAAAAGLKGDIDEAKTALAEFLKRKPDLGTISRLRAFEGSLSYTSEPRYVALRESTINAGLRRAGLPEE